MRFADRRNIAPERNEGNIASPQGEISLPSGAKGISLRRQAKYRSRAERREYRFAVRRNIAPERSEGISLKGDIVSCGDSDIDPLRDQRYCILADAAILRRTRRSDIAAYLPQRYCGIPAAAILRPSDAVDQRAATILASASVRSASFSPFISV